MFATEAQNIAVILTQKIFHLLTNQLRNLQPVTDLEHTDQAGSPYISCPISFSTCSTRFATWYVKQHSAIKTSN